MKIIKVLISIMLLIGLAHPLQAQESQQKLYRIYVKDFTRIKTIESKGITVYNRSPGAYIEVLATPGQIGQLNIEGSTIEFLANSFAELYPVLNQLKSIPGFHNYQATLDELAAIAAAHPDITRLDTIGFSLKGRAICSLKISDHPETDEDEPPVLFVGNHHGNEIHSVEAILYQIHYLVDHYGTDPEVTQWIDGMEIWYIPMTNPDGREAMTRGNDHGVDLNRNYSFGFTPGGGHGPTPFSEPETRAIRDFSAQFPPVMSLSYHTSGQYVLYSWTHTDDAAPDSAAMIYLGSLISESIVVAGTHYTLRQGGRWYFTAGEYCDFMYVTHNTLAFTVEMGTSQSPDYSVVPAMIEGNLKGMKTLLRQVNRAGVTGLVTDAGTGAGVPAIIDIPTVERQGKVPLRQADSRFGRYYRYLEPGTYAFQISAPGYRTLLKEITVSADSLTHWDIQMERAPFLEVAEVVIQDGEGSGTSGNRDGHINIGEQPGLSFALNNQQEISASRVYAKIGSDNPNIRFVSDSLYFGDISRNGTGRTPDLALFRIDPATPDGELLNIRITISDSAGFGWLEHTSLVAYTPKPEVTQIRIDDKEDNGNGVIDNGETVTLELGLTNNGHQVLQDVAAQILTENPYYQIVTEQDGSDRLEIGQEHIYRFKVALSASAPKAFFARFTVRITSAEGFSQEYPFELNNIRGFYDDFERGVNGWSHGSYGSTSNPHDDWQLGKPAGKAGDPDQPFSGLSCWGNDMGWDDYAGTSWDGFYQANQYNFLSSPPIDCAGFTKVGLKFMRWLTIRTTDYARIKVNGVEVWESPRTGIMDTTWNEQILDISEIADHNPAVVVTFELWSNGSGTAGGWNIDHVIVADGLAAGSSSAEAASHPSETTLNDSWPNPFGISTTIRYHLGVEGPVELSIFNLTGIKVRTLVSVHQAAGDYQTVWDGKYADSQTVPPGLYLYQLKTGNTLITKRLIFLN